MKGTRSVICALLGFGLGLGCTTLLGETDIPPATYGDGGSARAGEDGAIPETGVPLGPGFDASVGDASSMDDASPGAGGDDGHVAPIADSGGDDGYVAPTADGGDCEPADSGLLGTLGCPCSTPGALACNGRAQHVVLLCENGVWTASTLCPADQLCDSQLGLSAGTCLPIDPNCADAGPGQDVCTSLTTFVQCGPDLVSDSPAGTCTSSACVGGACSGVCAPGATHCADDIHVETCTTQGQWGAPVACPKACASEDAGTDGNCSGVCIPGETQCSNNGVQTCNSAGAWGSPVTCATHTTCVPVSGADAGDAGSQVTCSGPCGPGDTELCNAYPACNTSTVACQANGNFPACPAPSSPQWNGTAIGGACTMGVGACATTGTVGCATATTASCSATPAAPSSWHTTPASNGSWDWNCDGTVTLEYPMCPSDTCRDNFGAGGGTTACTQTGAYCTCYCSENLGNCEVVTNTCGTSYIAAKDGYTLDWLECMSSGEWDTPSAAEGTPPPPMPCE